MPDVVKVAERVAQSDTLTIVLVTVTVCGAILFIVGRAAAKFYISTYTSLLNDHKEARIAYHESLKAIIKDQFTFMQELNVTMTKCNGILTLVSTQLNEARVSRKPDHHH